MPADTPQDKEKPGFVDIRRASRDTGYKDVIAKIIEAGVCPFCPQNFNWHQGEILQRKGKWFITTNAWPYKNAEHHLLIIPTEHMENISELTDVDFLSVRALVEWAMTEYLLSGGGLILRFGDTRFTGASVKHLHFHFIVPVAENGEVQPVWAAIG